MNAIASMKPISSAGVTCPRLPSRSVLSRSSLPKRFGPGRAGTIPVRATMDPSEALQHVNVVSTLLTHIPLAYEPVALPCSLMKCGDVVHRSTLDLVLRKEVTGLDWRGVVLLAGVGVYLFLTPGVLPGFIDYYILGPGQRALYAKAYGMEDLVLGKRLGSGGFGSVFKAQLKEEDGTMQPVVVKKAKEFGEAEVWMNERMMRAGSSHIAKFVTAFTETAARPGSVQDKSVWLVWAYEGDFTLADLMQKPDFPYNMEPILLGRELRLARGARRRQATVKTILTQLLEALKALHATGIVHRDIKPQNCILSEEDRKIKLIDLGAAADLRVGINYVPNEYLLDPRYAPPQQYIMSRQTPKPPPKPVAALLSPVLWRMENPDRFDMYSVGVLAMQLIFPGLRSDGNLIKFNKRMEALNYDLKAWKRQEEKKAKEKRTDMTEGFELLALDGGQGWDLLSQLLSYKPSDRLSAAAALAHPFLGSEGLSSDLPMAPMATALSNAGRAVGTAIQAELLEDALKRSLDGSLTEVQLAEELGMSEREAPIPSGSQTIAWFQQRQNELQRKLEKRGSMGRGGSSSPSDVSKPNGKGVVRAGSNGRSNGKSNGKAVSNGNDRGLKVNGGKPVFRALEGLSMFGFTSDKMLKGKAAAGSDSEDEDAPKAEKKTSILENIMRLR